MQKYFQNQQLVIISFIVLLFVISSIWLFYISDKFMNPDYNTDWWVLYFEDPKSQSLNFTIENHSSKNNFHWEVLEKKNKLQEGDVQLSKGNKKDISIDIPPKSDKKITVRISADNIETKEIYKNY